MYVCLICSGDAMRALPVTPAGERRVSAVPPRIMGPDVDAGNECVRRQASVTAGEDIKIVIHDVDSEGFLFFLLP
jgi:hypothetical protein